MYIRELVRECHKNAVSKGFWEKKSEVGTLLMLIVSELGEAIEAHRKGKFSKIDMYELDIPGLVELGVMEKEDAKKKSFEKNIKDTFEDEIADVFIRLFDLCGGLNMDIEKNIKLKMEYNKKREYLHGKKY